MKLKNLHVENIRSYRKLDIAFEDGVTVISGVNGSGKSSLLEACFMGLFGSKILSKDFVLADMIFKGEEKAAIDLDFEHMGRDYRLEQGFRHSKNSKSASNSKCVLYVDGESLVDQTGRTYEEVCSLLKMDEEAYQNCAYIRQGEIDVLINAKPKDRQRMIDELLQLGKLEEYRERVRSAKTGIGRLERDAKISLRDVRAEIENIEETGPVQALNTAREKAKTSDEELKKLKEIKESAASEKEKLDHRLAEYKERAAEIGKLKAETEKARQEKGKCFGEKEKRDREIRQKKEAWRELEDENSVIRQEAGFGDLEVETLLLRQEKEEALAREKLNGISNELALVLKDKNTLEKMAGDLEKDIKEAEKAAEKCKTDIEAEKTGIEAKQRKSLELEEKSSEIRAKAGIKTGIKTG
ncbi:MAG: AAA family ATPase, partial [Methanosarcinaceae archaeon]|nr:AAA family ATPase [Methanosarcinaceae archaeon]